jgi:hypothetical protein
MTPSSWAKVYKKWLFEFSKDQSYDNEIITNAPFDFIKPFK